MQKALLIVPHDPKHDPRVSYWVDSLRSKGFEITVLYCSEEKRFSRAVFFESSRIKDATFIKGTVGYLALKKWISEPNPQYWLKTLLGGLKDSPEHSRWHIQTIDSFFSTMFITEQLSQLLPNFDVVMGLDIQGAVAMQSFSRDSCQTFLYDAQEVNPFASSSLTEFESKWWIAFETQLLSFVDEAVTVSPGIATWYKDTTGFDLGVIPNWVPRSLSTKTPIQVDESEEFSRPVRFLYYGGIAENRGVESLVDSWNLPSSIATLTISSPNDSSKVKIQKIWRDKDRSKSQVIFTEKSPDDDLIHWISTFDVGILPYDYKYPYSHASPNKFGQYLAANLAILSNSQEFVSAMVEEFGFGIVKDFKQLSDIDLALNDLVKPEILQAFKSSSMDAFVNELNWDQAFEDWFQNRFLEIHSVTSQLSTEKSNATVITAIPKRIRFASFAKSTPHDFVQFLKERVIETLSRSVFAQQGYSYLSKLMGSIASR